MTQYTNGVKFEYFVRDFYVKRGFIVIRSAGSKGSVDLVCINSSEVILVQCKKERKGKSYRDDLFKLSLLPSSVFIKKELWVKHVRGDITIYNEFGKVLEVLSC